MSNKYITQLPRITSPQFSGETIYDNGTTTYKMSLQTLTDFLIDKINNENLIDVTYSELTSNITGSTLKPGYYYNITNFKTCYDQPDFNSYGNEIIGNNYKQSEVEPIIVFAISANTISSTAYQPKYPKDRIQYDWTFNITERTNGVAYGRISERIDEFNNRTDYDHRTILFKRYEYIEIDFNNPYTGTVSISPTSGTEMIVNGTDTIFTNSSIGEYVGFEFNNNFNAYEITSISSDTLMTITGLTNTNSGGGVQMFLAYGQTNTSYKQNNITTGYTEYYTFDYGNFNVNNYIGNFANSYVYDENSFILANNVFHGSGYRNNKFGDMCYNNSFDNDCENNTIGNYFYNNITDNDFDGNIIGNWFNNNRITSKFQYNRIGENFQFNYLVQNRFYRNNIMNGFEYNIVSGGNFQNNEIGSGFNNNILRNGQFYKNDIGNGYNFNKVYSNSFSNLIGNGFAGNNIYCEFYENTIGEYYNNNTLGNISNPSSKEFYKNRIGNSFNGNVITNNFFKNDMGNDFYNNNISGETYTNKIGERFENNTIYNDFYDNQIFNEFKGNMIYQSFYQNRLDFGFGGFGGNHFSGTCVGNTFGPGINSNDFLGSVYTNTFKGVVYGNTIGDNFNGNNIGFGFFDNIIGENFGFGSSEPQGNIIGNNFHNNTIGEYFYNNTIPDNFYYNKVGNYFQWNVINTNIGNTDFTLNYGNITGFSYVSNGNTAGNALTTNITGVTNGNGVGTQFTITSDSGTIVGVDLTNCGKFYLVNDTITILGTQIGGTTPTDDVVITVTGTSETPVFYEHHTKQMFEIRGGNKRVSYYDKDDVLNLDPIGISFTINSSDFSNGYHIYQDTTPLGLNGTGGFQNTASQNNLYQGFYGNGLNGNSLSEITAVYSVLGFSQYDSVGRLWYVTWGVGSSVSSGIVKFGCDVNGNYFDIQTIDTSDTNYLTTDNSNGTSLVGTFKFPATFTIYKPIINKIGWC